VIYMVARNLLSCCVRNLSRHDVRLLCQRLCQSVGRSPSRRQGGDPAAISAHSAPNRFVDLEDRATHVSARGRETCRLRMVSSKMVYYV